ncbi:hypothetical protein R6Z07F_009328 [Ovis aries]
MPLQCRPGSPLTRTPAPAPQRPGSPPSAQRRPVLAAHTPPARRLPSQRPGLSSPPGACAVFCEKAVEPARELPPAAEGRLPEAGRRECGGGRAPPGAAALGLHNREGDGGCACGSTPWLGQVSDSREEAKDLLRKNHMLQDEIATLRLEIDAVKDQHQEKEKKYFEDIEIAVVRQLRQELDDAVKKQSMSEASLEVLSLYCAKLEAEAQDLKNNCKLLQLRQLTSQTQAEFQQMEFIIKDLESELSKMYSLQEDSNKAELQLYLVCEVIKSLEDKVDKHSSLLVVGAEVRVGRSSSHTGQAQLANRAGRWSLSLQSFPLDLANEQDTPYTSPREGSDHHPPTCEAQCRLQTPGHLGTGKHPEKIGLLCLQDPQPQALMSHPLSKNIHLHLHLHLLGLWQENPSQGMSHHLCRKSLPWLLPKTQMPSLTDPLPQGKRAPARDRDLKPFLETSRPGDLLALQPPSPWMPSTCSLPRAD